MASPKPYLLTIIFSLLFTIFTLTSSQSHSQDPSVFDILPKFDLPSGLLPDCVVNHTFSPDDGSFAVELEKPTYVQFDYLVYYDRRITGTLKLGSIKNIQGIQVKRFLFWLDVDEIKVDLPPADSIYFQVGIINKKLSVDQFKTVHSCSSSSSVASSSPRPWKFIFELPPPIDDEIPMLLTE